MAAKSRWGGMGVTLLAPLALRAFEERRLPFLPLPYPAAMLPPPPGVLLDVTLLTDDLAPRLMAGDVLLIDPWREPVPGDVVLAHLMGRPGTLFEARSCVLRYNADGDLYSTSGMFVPAGAGAFVLGGVAVAFYPFDPCFAGYPPLPLADREPETTPARTC